MHWVDARDLLADGLATGGIDRIVLHNVSNNRLHRALHGALIYKKAFRTLHCHSCRAGSGREAGIVVPGCSINQISHHHS